MQDQSFFPKDKTAMVVLLIAAAFFALVRLYPIFDALVLSLQHKVGAQQYWVGLENFRTLFKDTIFLKSVWNSFRYTAMAVPGVVAVGLVLAMLVNGVKNTLLRGAFTTSFFLAYVVPLVAVAVMWRYLYLPGRMGLFNALLGLVGLGPVRWLDSPKTALLSLAIVRVWKYSGYAMVLFLAGLQAIPDTFYEAAMIDGASRWQRFRHITLPLLAPTTLFVVMVSILSAFMMFTEVYVMTGGMVTAADVRGGPQYSTTTMVFNIYTTAFEHFKMGYASAMTVILLILMVIVSVIQFKYLRPTWEY
ncbi:MAG: ABC transporter permease subunit [Anaerolineae bacterium]|nr:ABC transporter permease subunit [Anaerolineae bacterium]